MDFTSEVYMEMLPDLLEHYAIATNIMSR